MFQCTAREKGELIALWHQAFGDERREIEAFFHRFSKTGELLFDRSEGRVVSALYLLPQRLFVRGEEYPVAYLYAAATDEAHRGGGRMGRLIERAFSWCEKQGLSACVTLPASDSLYGYYERFGFQPCYGQRRVAVSGSGEVPRELFEGLSYEHYCETLRGAECALIKSRETFETVLSYPGVRALSFEGGYAILSGGQVVDAAGGMEALNAIAISEKQSSFTTHSAAMGEQVRYGSVKLFRELSVDVTKTLYMTMMME